MTKNLLVAFTWHLALPACINSPTWGVCQRKSNCSEALWLCITPAPRAACSGLARGILPLSAGRAESMPCMAMAKSRDAFQGALKPRSELGGQCRDLECAADGWGLLFSGLPLAALRCAQMSCGKLPVRGVVCLALQGKANVLEGEIPVSEHLRNPSCPRLKAGSGVSCWRPEHTEGCWT